MTSQVTELIIERNRLRKDLRLAVRALKSVAVWFEDGLEDEWSWSTGQCCVCLPTLIDEDLEGFDGHTQGCPVREVLSVLNKFEIEWAPNAVQTA